VIRTMPSHTIYIKIHFNTIFHLRLGLSSRLFPSGVPTRVLCTSSYSSLHATCSVHLFLLHFIALTIYVRRTNHKASPASVDIYRSIVYKIISHPTETKQQFHYKDQLILVRQGRNLCWLSQTRDTRGDVHYTAKRYFKMPCSGVQWQQISASRDGLNLGFRLGERNSPVIISYYCFMLWLFVVKFWRSELAFGILLVPQSAATPAVIIEAYRGFTRYCHVNGWLVPGLGHTRSLPNSLHSWELRSSGLLRRK
jgi:hypothetical protein